MRKSLYIAMAALIAYFPLLICQWTLGISVGLTYLKDFFCLPVILGFSEWFIGRVVLKKQGYQLSWSMILVAFLAVSIVFEWWLPKINTIYTADVFDVVMYALGVLVYVFFRRRLMVGV